MVVLSKMTTAEAHPRQHGHTLNSLHTKHMISTHMMSPARRRAHTQQLIGKLQAQVAAMDLPEVRSTTYEFQAGSFSDLLFGPHLKTMADSSEGMSQSIRMAAETLSQNSDNVVQQLAQLQDQVSQSMGMVDKTLSAIKYLAMTLSLCAFTLLVSRMIGFKVIAIMVILTEVVLSIFGYVCIKASLRSFQAFMDRRRAVFDRYEMQSGGYAPWMIASAMSLLYIVGTKTTVSTTVFDAFLRRADLISRVTFGATNMVTVLDPILRDASNAIRRHFGDPDASEEEDVVSQWVREFQEVVHAPDFRSQIMTKSEVVDKVNQLMKRYDYLARNMQRMSIQEKTQLSSFTTEVLKAYGMARESPVGLNSSREVPLTILLHGDSGIGKTQLVNKIIIDVFRDVLTAYNDKDPLTAIYTRNTEQEYWDGYVGQPIVVADDAFQQVDGPGHPDPFFFELIRLTNSWPFMLHMADLAEKNNTVMRAKGVLITSNGLPNIQSLHCKEAVLRRIHVCVKPYIIPEYLLYDDTPDWDKVKKECGSPTATQIYKFHVTDISDGFTIDHFTYKDFVLYCRSKRQQLTEATSEVASDYLEYFRQGGMDGFELQAGDEEQNLREERDEFLECDEQPECSQQDVRLHQDEMDEAIVERSGIEISKFYRLPIYVKRELEVNLAYYTSLFAQQMRDVRDTTWVQRVSLEDNTIASTTRRWLGAAKTKYQQTIQADSHAAMVVKGVGLGIVVMTIIKTFSSLTDRASVSTEHNITSPDFQMQSNEIQTRAPRRTKLKKLQWQAGDQTPLVTVTSSDNQSRNIVQLMMRYMYVLDLHFERDGEQKRIVLGNMIAVEGKFCLMNHHVAQMIQKYEHLAPTGVVIVRSPNLVAGKRIPISTFYTSFGIPNTDACIVKMPRTFNDSPDNVKHFMTYAVAEKFLSTPGSLIGLVQVSDKTNSTYTFIEEPLTQIVAGTETVSVGATDQDTMVVRASEEERSYYRYKGPFTRGRCGSLLVAKNNHLAQKLMGIHFSGNSTTGLSAAVYQEDLRHAIQKYKESFEKEQSAPGVDKVEFQGGEITVGIVQPSDLPLGEFVGVGRAPPVHRHTKTKLRRSLLYGALTQPNTAPAALAPDGSRDPLPMALSKAGGPDVHIEQEYFDLAVEETISETNAQDVSVPQELEHSFILSYEQAVCGIEGAEGYAGIPRKTSMGYPYVLQPQVRSGKRDAWGDDGDYTLNTPLAKQIQENVEHRLQQAKKGVRVPAIWIDSLKDERRPLEKVAALKTRAFCNGPVDFNIACIQMFGAFRAHIVRHRVDNGIAIGVNPYSLEWDLIAKHLLGRGSRIMAGDFSNFDGTLSSQVLWSALDVIEAWYKFNDPSWTPEDQQIRHVLFADIANSVHLYKNSIYMWTHSQPSGCVLTAHLNSICNLLLIKVVFMIVSSRQLNALLPLSVMRSSMRYMVFGDDNLISVAPDVQSWFTPQAVQDAFQELGMTYTNEDKSGPVAYKPLQEVSFLKRGFVYDKTLSRYIGPLDKDVIYELLNWTRDSADPEQAVIDNLDIAFTEIAYHGKAEYQILAMRIAKFLRNMQPVHDIPYTIPSHAEHVLAHLMHKPWSDKVIKSMNLPSTALALKSPRSENAGQTNEKDATIH